MSQRLTQYFAEEAADYLQQLAALLSAPDRPDPVRFLRLATGVRGSTQMAGADDLAELAGRFEGLARGLVDGSAEWSDPLGDVSRRIVSEMLTLVYSIDRWGEEEDARVRAAVRLWIEPAPGEAESNDYDLVSIESLFFDDAGPHIIESPLDGEDGSGSGAEWRDSAIDDGELPLVSIEQLLYDGPDALRAALALRPVFDSFARGDVSANQPFHELVDELFDLIALGLRAESTEA